MFCNIFQGNIYQDDQHGIPDNYYIQDAYHDDHRGIPDIHYIQDICQDCQHGIYYIHYIQDIQEIYQDDQHDEVVEELLGDNPVDQFADTEREHNVKNCLLTQIRFQQKVL